MPLILPDTITNGTPNDGDEVQGILDAITDKFDGNIGPDDLESEAVTLAKIATGVGGRVLDIRAIPPYSYGANNAGDLMSFAVTHSGKSGLYVAMSGGVVHGAATPYGWAPRVKRDGANVGVATVSQSVLDEFMSWSIVGAFGALTGPHTWAVEIETGNNPNTWRNIGSGFIAILEQY